jgi:hypothetical protein
LGRSPIYFSSATDNYLALNGLWWNAENSLARLRSQAGDLGFTVTLVPETPNGTTPTVVTVTQRSSPRRYWRSLLHREDAEKLSQIYIDTNDENHSFFGIEEFSDDTNAPSPTEMKSDSNPVADVEVRLRGSTSGKQDPDGMFVHVFRFTLTNTGYKTSFGESLEQVMESCDNDDDYRRSCVVILPVYEQSLENDLVLTKYQVVKRPLSGIIPRGFPKAYLVENYEYYTELPGAEIGELVTSINLAPGEQRKLTVVRSLERESEQHQSASSLLDITTENRTDFSSEVERQARNEQQSSSTVGASANAGLNLGIVSFGGGGSFSTTQSSQHFDSYLGRVVQKASNSVQRRMKQEVSTSASSRLRSLTSETTELTVRNMNEGRSLNLLLHGINRRLRGGLRLTGFELLTSQPVELVDRTGSFPNRRFPFSNDGLNLLLASLSRGQYPSGLRGTLNAGNTSSFSYDLCSRIIEQMKSILINDYKPVCKIPVNSGSPGELVDPVFVLSIKDDKGKYIPIDRLELSLKPYDSGTPKLANSDAEKISFGRVPLSPRIVRFPTMTLFMDAQVGFLPATEPYFEAMRQQEVRVRQAAAYKDYTIGLLREAKAHKLVEEKMPPSLLPLRFSSIEIKSFSTTDSQRKIFTLNFSAPVPKGNWHLYLRNNLISEKETKTSSEESVQFVTGDPQLWLDHFDNILPFLSLINKSELVIIRGQGAKMIEAFPWLSQILGTAEYNACGRPNK